MTSNMAAAFDALRNDDVATRGFSGPRFIHRSDLPAGERASLVDRFDKLLFGRSVKEFHQPNMPGRDVDASAIEERHQKIDAKRTVRQSTHRFDHRHESLGGVANRRHHSKTARM